MTAPLYVDRDSVVHRIPPGYKVLSLVVVGTVVFLIRDWRILTGILVVVAALYLLARIPWRTAVRSIRPGLFMLVFFFVVAGLLTDWLSATLVVLRLAALLLVATAVTLTTRTSAMIESLERALYPLRRVGVNPEKVSLAFSLALRFVPVVARITLEVREAQRVRGMDRNLIAVALPVVIRTLRMADDIADAVDARSFGG
ncbi:MULTISPECIES: energy-coupling factor transporter transmembrane component T family protein [Amycolatopsis]|uniref:Biotin transport system permease protein n=2 Tax=Amycolatopsis TaxID=1813 RepID=A0A1I3XDV7_9PSEU|nr:energy-coupling factor transporter transmembrane protein EcfT [Amycolatopsis sacchari]SFK17226.1 biotin transport system permease protein [Amycolatopsis sacchari]